jgi:chemotaxis protein CheD
MSESFSCIVQAGHLAYSEDPAFLCAICGNGVIITLRDRILCIGGMAHVVYPKLEAENRPTNFHVGTALRSLIKVLLDLGSTSSAHIEAQIFGGGHQNGLGKKRAEDCVREIRKILKEKKINIISEDVGGSLGRKIIFNTSNGETAAIKTSRIRRMDWLPEWEHQIGVKRIAYARGE